MRFETNESFNDRIGRGPLAEILFAVGAKRIRLRCLYGSSNQPQVVTFAANSQEHANKLAAAAYELMVTEDQPSLPSLFARHYKR